MLPTPPIHLVVMQPTGYVHSLGFLDPARYVRHQLRRLGAQVSIGKNRLREDAVNIVFGAHLGFLPAWCEQHTCVFFNMEQIGHGGADVRPEYLALLRNAQVVDYDAANVRAYRADPSEVTVLPLGHAPYLERDGGLPLAERPIDLLFFGSVNPRRQQLLDRIEACGVTVSVFDAPLYGPERDDFIRQAKAVLNCHFYDSSRFEQARVAHCLSLGTPVVSERRPQTEPGADFEPAVGWFDDAGLEAFFAGHFGTAAWQAEAEAQLAHFRRVDPLEPYRDLLDHLARLHDGHRRRRPGAPRRPTRINLGSGKDYRTGWLNIDVLERAEPDLVLDLGQPITLPLTQPTRHGGVVTLAAGQVEHLYANNVLEHVPDLPRLMGNALTLLKPGGEFEIEVPYEKSPTAWQDPTHLRAMNENSWLYYTDWFWYLGWFEHRFEIAASAWLDLELKPCPQERAAFMKVRLRKVATTPRERTVARAMRPDFGGIDEDLQVALNICDWSGTVPGGLDGLPASADMAVGAEPVSLRRDAPSAQPAPSPSTALAA
jgi:hypothetical protein